MNILKSILKSILSLIFLFPFVAKHAYILPSMQCIWTTSLNYLNWLKRIWKRGIRSIKVFVVGYSCVQHLWHCESPSPFDLTCSSLIGCLSNRIAPCPHCPGTLSLPQKRRVPAWQNLQVEQNIQVSKFIHSLNQNASLFSTIFNLSFVSQSAKRNWIHRSHLKIDFSREPGKHQQAWCAAIGWYFELFEWQSTIRVVADFCAVFF